jgi:hypothetical protein
MMKHRKLTKSHVRPFVINDGWFIVWVIGFPPEDFLAIIILLFGTGAYHFRLLLFDGFKSSALLLFLLGELEVLAPWFSFFNTARIAWATPNETTSFATWGVIHVWVEFVYLGDYFRGDSLLLHESFLIGIWGFLILTIWRLFVELSPMDFEHGASLVSLEDFLEKVLFDEWVIGICLDRFSEIFLFIKDFD